MPATSKQQQKLMGLVHALQKGSVKPGQASAKAKEMAKSMKPSDVKDFAATKHKGLPKKVKKEDYNPTKMYVVVKPSDNMNASGMIKELNPLEGIQPLNIMQDDVMSVHHDEKEAQRIAAEAYDKYCNEVQALEEKKGKVGDKIKKTIDHLEKKRKEHVDMAKEDPKSAAKHKEHIAKLATQIDDLMSKMEKIEKSKKNVEKKEDEKNIKESILNEADISFPSELDIMVSKKRGDYIIFAGKEGDVRMSFSELSKLAKEITNFINQLPDGKMTTNIEVSGGLEGLDISCHFTTSLSKEELEQLSGKRI